MRMHMRRYTRLTNAFSKKFMSHVHMVALYTVWYNWMRLQKKRRVTPAMASGLTDKLMGFEDLVAIMDVAAPAPNPFPCLLEKTPANFKLRHYPTFKLGNARELVAKQAGFDSWQARKSGLSSQKTLIVKDPDGNLVLFAGPAYAIGIQRRPPRGAWKPPQGLLVISGRTASARSFRA
jgi:hypothetical protein